MKNIMYLVLAFFCGIATTAVSNHSNRSQLYEQLMRKDSIINKQEILVNSIIYHEWHDHGCECPVMDEDIAQEVWELLDRDRK